MAGLFGSNSSFGMSSLFGNNSSSVLSDWAFIRSGTYKKLMKAYYGQDKTTKSSSIDSLLSALTVIPIAFNKVSLPVVVAVRLRTLFFTPLTLLLFVVSIRLL